MIKIVKMSLTSAVCLNSRKEKSKANKMTALIAFFQSYSLSLNKGAVSLDGSLTIDLIENSVMTERIK